MRSLQSIFRDALRSALLAGPVLAAGCDDYPPGIETEPGFVPVECSGGQRLWLAELTPEPPVDYLELRLLVGPEGEFSSVETQGDLCAGASDRGACLAAFGELPAEAGFRFGDWSQLGPGPDAQLFATRADAAVAILRSEDLRSFLGSIDTHGEAVFLAAATQRDVPCSRGGSRKNGRDFEVQTFTSVGCDGRNRQLLRVTPAGEVTLLSEVTEREADPNCVVGRRPEGFREPAGDCHTSAVGAYLARGALLEAASVHAFKRLRSELLAHDAPSALVRAAGRAAADEVRHAALMSGLARRFGGRPQPARVGVLPIRDLETIAIENATEGCVRETFGALSADWQALHARSEELARAYGAIAKDELRHARLAWRVAHFAEHRLSAPARRRVREAQQEAVRSLAGELATEPHSELVHHAGLPRSKPAARLLAHLEKHLFSQGSSPESA